MLAGDLTWRGGARQVALYGPALADTEARINSVGLSLIIALGKVARGNSVGDDRANARPVPTSPPF